MAITWGPWINNNTGNGFRLGYEFTQSAAVTGSTTSVSVRCRGYVQTRYSVYDSNNTAAISGAFTGSKSVNISHGNSGGTTLIWDSTRTVTPSYSGTVTTSVSMSLSGLEAIPGTARVSGSHVTARRPGGKPAAPTNVTATHVEDNHVKIAWSLSQVTNSEATSLELQRWDIQSGEYKTLTNPSAATRSYANKSTGGNSRYRYRIRAKNAAGASDWAYSPYVSTTPTYPTNVKAAKDGTGITVTWSDNAAAESGFEIVERQDGGVWNYAGVVRVGPGVKSWTHAKPDASVTHQYAVRAVAGYDTKVLYSAYEQSNVVDLLKPPLAPKLGRPLFGYDDAALPVAFRWSHNGVDTTHQTKYEIRWRPMGTTAWTYEPVVTSPAGTHTFPAGKWENGSEIEWQIRNWGEHATASPWSVSGALRLSERPSAGIVTPGDVVQSNRVNVEWTFLDAESLPQSAYEVVLFDDLGKEVGRASGKGIAKKATLDVPVLDGERYKIEVRVRDAHMLWSDTAVHTFSVQYLLPPVPTLHVDWDADLGVITILPEEGITTVGQVETDHIELFKSTDGETWSLVDGLSLSGVAIVDPTPVLNTTLYFKAVAVSNLPSIAEGPPVNVYTYSNGWAFWNYGVGFGMLARARFDLDPSDSIRAEKVTRQFAGRTNKVEFSGSSYEHDFDIGFTLDEESSSKADFGLLARAPAPVCYRLPNGEKHYVSVSSVKFSESTETSVGREVSATVTMEKVDG